MVAEKIVLEIHLNAKDLWRFSMHHANRGLQGVFNVGFSVIWLGMLIVNFQKLQTSNKLLYLFLALTFSVIQPAILYLKSMKQARTEGIRKGIRLTFSDEAFEVAQGEAGGILKWEEIYKTKFFKDMIVIYSTSMHGYLIPQRYWGEKKEALFALLKAKTNHE